MCEFATMEQGANTQTCLVSMLQKPYITYSKGGPERGRVVNMVKKAVSLTLLNIRSSQCETNQVLLAGVL